MDINNKIAEELGVMVQQVAASIALLDEGSTVPFISRYRKEATGGLDDLQLRDLEVRLRYLRELQERKQTIVASIAEQDKLTPELEKKINAAETKSILEDLYLPYKKKRRTKAMIAIEAGIEPLADKLLENPTLEPEHEAAAFVDTEAGFTDAKAVLDGAKQILMERFAEHPELSGSLRNYLWEEGVLQSRVVEGKENDAAKFRDYFDYDEPLKRVPSH
ncbi:MAG: RNA-binding transcriptional accessory protein, partial [OM182 bacterium]|nr:RNA-binding transcriptional accessory protein [OM182 bacterium]